MFMITASDRMLTQNQAMPNRIRTTKRLTSQGSRLHARTGGVKFILLSSMCILASAKIVTRYNLYCNGKPVVIGPARNCPECGGSGKRGHEYVPCYACRKTGRIPLKDVMKGTDAKPSDGKAEFAEVGLNFLKVAAAGGLKHNPRAGGNGGFGMALMNIVPWQLLAEHALGTYETRRGADMWYSCSEEELIAHFHNQTTTWDKIFNTLQDPDFGGHVAMEQSHLFCWYPRNIIPSEYTDGPYKGKKVNALVKMDFYEHSDGKLYDYKEGEQNPEPRYYYNIDGKRFYEIGSELDDSPNIRRNIRVTSQRGRRARHGKRPKGLPEYLRNTKHWVERPNGILMFDDPDNCNGFYQPGAPEDEPDEFLPATVVTQDTLIDTVDPQEEESCWSKIFCCGKSKKD